MPLPLKSAAPRRETGRQCRTGLSLPRPRRLPHPTVYTKVLALAQAETEPWLLHPAGPQHTPLPMGSDRVWTPSVLPTPPWTLCGPAGASVGLKRSQGKELWCRWKSGGPQLHMLMLLFASGVAEAGLGLGYF